MFSAKEQSGNFSALNFSKLELYNTVKVPTGYSAGSKTTGKSEKSSSHCVIREKLDENSHVTHTELSIINNIGDPCFKMCKYYMSGAAVGAFAPQQEGPSFKTNSQPEPFSAEFAGKDF